MPKKRKQVSEIWVDDAFPVNEILTCRLKGDVARPDSACMTLMCHDDAETDAAEPMFMTLSGLQILENFASQLNEFLARMKSAGTH